MSILQTKHLEKVYSGRKVVKDISISVGTDEITGLLGPNGAGKTQLRRSVSYKRARILSTIQSYKGSYPLQTTLFNFMKNDLELDLMKSKVFQISLITYFTNRALSSLFFGNIVRSSFNKLASI